jgi:hypothetical protein
MTEQPVDIGRLSAQVEHLTRHIRWLQALGLMGLVLVVGAALLAATRPGPMAIEAHEFRLVDARGVLRGLWSVVPSSGETILRLGGGDGITRFGVAVTPEGAELVLVGAQPPIGVPSETHLFAIQAHTGVSLKDQNARVRLMIGRNNLDDTTKILILDVQEVTRYAIPPGETK